MNINLKAVILLIFTFTLTSQDSPKIQKVLLSTNKPTNTFEYGLQKITLSDDFDTILKLIENIDKQNSSTCQIKAKQVQQIIKILQTKLNNNEKQINLLNQQKQETQNKSVQKLKEALLKMKKQIEQSNTVSLIKIKEIEKEATSANIKKQTKMISQYLQNIQEMKKGNSEKSNKNDAAIQKLEDQMDKLDRLIEEVDKKRAIVSNNITALKIKQLENSHISFVNPDQIQQKYKEYSQLAFQSLRNSKDKQDQIAKLSAKLKNLSQNPTTIDKQIQKVNQQIKELKKDENSKKVEDWDDISEVLITYSSSLQGKIQGLLKQCLN